MKRGVSALVATVLLISFGIMLTIFIMNWGTNFLKTSQADVEKQSREKFGCTTDVSFVVRCECLSEGGDLSECQFKLTNNEDSIIKTASYRLFRGDKFLVSNVTTLGQTGLRAWDVSDYYGISGIPSGTPSDNVKIEVLATQIDVGGTIINCGDLSSSIANCLIVTTFSE